MPVKLKDADKTNAAPIETDGVIFQGFLNFTKGRPISIYEKDGVPFEDAREIVSGDNASGCAHCFQTSERRRALEGGASRPCHDCRFHGCLARTPC
jgi:hypothetical protein